MFAPFGEKCACTNFFRRMPTNSPYAMYAVRWLGKRQAEGRKLYASIKANIKHAW